MCSTCNFKKYEKVEITAGNVILQQNLGEGSLVIRCDPGGQKYRIAVKTEPRSEYRIYRCLTCGRQLF